MNKDEAIVSSAQMKTREEPRETPAPNLAPTSNDDDIINRLTSVLDKGTEPPKPSDDLFESYKKAAVSEERIQKIDKWFDDKKGFWSKADALPTYLSRRSGNGFRHMRDKVKAFKN